jgi:hypothetical protein
MARAVNGFQVLSVIGKHPDLFSDIHTEIIKQAGSLFGSQVAKSDLNKIKAIYVAIGADEFGKLVDLIGKKIGAALKKIDKYNPALKGMPEHAQRSLFTALASGEIAPCLNLEKERKAREAQEKKAKKARAAEEKERLKARAAAAKGASKKKNNTKKSIAADEDEGVLGFRSMQPRNRSRKR